MTISDLKTLIVSLPDDMKVVSSCFGHKLKTPTIDFVQMVTFHYKESSALETYGWWKNDKLDYKQSNVEEKVLRIQ